MRPQCWPCVAVVLPALALLAHLGPAYAGPVPSIGAGPPRAVPVADCSDPAKTPIYLVTVDDRLLAFNPGETTFRDIATLACPAPSGWHPFSMAVDRGGTAYVLYVLRSFDASLGAGRLYRVSTVTGACEATSYRGERGQPEFDQFGMGFAGSPDGKGDTLYVASSPDRPYATGKLGVISLARAPLLDDLRLRVVGTLAPNDVERPELSGTGDGRLFAFYATDDGDSSAIAQVDPRTARVLANDEVPGVSQGVAWAFAFWGGDFYLFTAPVDTIRRSIVTRFRPRDHTSVTVATAPGLVVGAGVSTCAPQLLSDRRYREKDPFWYSIQMHAQKSARAKGSELSR